MEKHPETNCNEITRQAIQEEIGHSKMMDGLTSESELTESEVRGLAGKINECGRKRVEELSE